MGPKNTGVLLSKLRSLMKGSPYAPEGLQAYIIPTDDAHQSEYIAECDKRREFITGFTGSAGTAVVTDEHAALWTDGRYYLQATDQLDGNWTLMRDGLKNTLSQADWLKKILKPGSCVGVDPNLMSANIWKPLEEKLVEGELRLVAVQQNLVDSVWGEEQPCRPNNEVFIQPLEYAGASWQEKVDALRKKMMEKDAEALVVTALDDVAWLFNLRGSDIEFNPVFFAYGLITMNRVVLFIDDQKLTKEALEQLRSGDPPSVEILPYDSIMSTLTEHTQMHKGKVWVGKKSSYALFDAVPKKKRLSEPTPIALMKAIKNEAEISGMRKAHIKDAVALCEFFKWLEIEVPKGNVSEIAAAEKCLEFRKQQKEFISPSFETISGVGDHAAIIHYRVTPETDARLALDKVYLCDSGAQFRDGTTDVTRTVHYGTPLTDEKEAFTRVLKGHIALSETIFPTGIRGSMLDSFARASLWQVGLDYLHGTGHGVGAFLNCHEGPCGISFRVRPDEETLQEGMILSNEPGYYEDNKFGIRIESLVLVKKVETKHNFKNMTFLGFEPITLFPIQKSMIIPSLLTKEEKTWLNSYHQTCLEVVGEELKIQGRSNTYEWLKEQCTPLTDDC